MKLEEEQPFVILGMHRSGTTLVASLLGKCGLFQGQRLDQNHEPVFFQQLNRWVFRSAHCDWDSPEPLVHSMAAPEVVEWNVRYLRYLLSSPRFAEYWGFCRWGSQMLGVADGEPWGFKDPRTTLTLPIWSRIFPRARYLLIERHGLDVAASLLNRERRQSLAVQKNFERYMTGAGKRLYWLRRKRSGFHASPRCSTFHGALTLWAHYVERSREYTRGLEDRLLTLRYEDLLADPGPTFRTIARHAGVEVTPEATNGLCDDIDPKRAFAHRRNGLPMPLSVEDRALVSSLGFEDP